LILYVPRAGFEPATTDIRLNPKYLKEDLESFRLFAMAKLNLSKLTVSQYICKVRPFLEGRNSVSDCDVQTYIQMKKETCVGDYVSNVISAFKAYFRDYKGFSFMNSYKHPSTPLRMKEEIEPKTVKTFIEALGDFSLTVKCAALLLATSGLRKGEVLGLRKGDIDRKLRCIIPNCHSGETKHSGISFYNAEAETCLNEFEKTCSSEKDKLFVIGHQTFLTAWNKARKKTGINLKPKDLRDYFSQEMGKAFVPDRYIDIFQGRAPRNILAKHYTPQGIKLLRKIYDKAKLKILA
jgi:integrase